MTFLTSHPGSTSETTVFPSMWQPLFADSSRCLQLAVYGMCVMLERQVSVCLSASAQHSEQPPMTFLTSHPGSTSETTVFPSMWQPLFADSSRCLQLVVYGMCVMLERHVSVCLSASAQH